MNTKQLIALTAALAASLTLGCAKKDLDRAVPDPATTTPRVSETERPGSDSPSDITAATARMRVSDLKVASIFGADGAVVENIDNFTAGQPIVASIAVGDVGAGSAVEAIWWGPSDLRIHSEVKTVNAGATHVRFEAPPTANWAVGSYKIDIRLGDEIAETETFELQAPGRS